MRKRLLTSLLLGTITQVHAHHDSLEAAVSEARARYDGRVLSAETLRDASGRETYNVRILTPEGRVRRYRVRPDGRNEHGDARPSRRDLH